jgi:hypothetical protein
MWLEDVMADTKALINNLILSINRLVSTFPVGDKDNAVVIENAALRIFINQLKSSASSLVDSTNSLGALITRKQRTIHFDAAEQFKRLNGSVTLNALLVYQASIILDIEPQPSLEEKAELIAGITALQSVSTELSKHITKLHNDVISVI